ncbi:MAG: hypothetical protein NT069_25075 [Planctomycetota bacterium]|nr:hypothetical protein [Planctomycetota bacterium]
MTAAQSQGVADDAMNKVAQAMSDAAGAIRSGASDATEKARQLAPAAARVVGQTVYTTCYYLSYGVVFPTMFVASFIPKNNALVHGLVDGARAASDAVADLRASKAKSPEVLLEDKSAVLIPNPA